MKEEREMPGVEISEADGELGRRRRWMKGIKICRK
jgi:hypothetical protein